MNFAGRAASVLQRVLDGEEMDSQLRRAPVARLSTVFNAQKCELPERLQPSLHIDNALGRAQGVPHAYKRREGSHRGGSAKKFRRGEVQPVEQPPAVLFL